MPDQDEAATPSKLVLYCPHAHRLGTVTREGCQLTFDAERGEFGYMDKHYRYGRDIARAEADDLEELRAFASEVATIRHDTFGDDTQPQNVTEAKAQRAQTEAKAARFVDMRRRGTVPRLHPHPDEATLVWACPPCFRQGRNHATKRLAGPTHTGKLEWRALASVLAAAELTATTSAPVKATPAGTGDALRRLVGNETTKDARRRKELARSWTWPTPTGLEDFNRWQVTAFLVPR